MPSVEPLFHGLAVRHGDDGRAWLQIGEGKNCLKADADGIAIKGKRHAWQDVERIAVWTVQRSVRRTTIEVFFALIANQPGTQSGTFVSLLLRQSAFEKTHRCGPPVESATEHDDAAATSLLMRLKAPQERSDFFGP